MAVGRVSGEATGLCVQACSRDFWQIPVVPLMWASPQGGLSTRQVAPSKVSDSKERVHSTEDTDL